MLEISTTNQIIGSTYSAVIPDIYTQFKNDNDAEVFEKLVLDLMLNKYSEWGLQLNSHNWGTNISTLRISNEAQNSLDMTN